MVFQATAIVTVLDVTVAATIVTDPSASASVTVLDVEVSVEVTE